MTPATMNATAYAAYRGVGKSAVSNWKKKGLLVFREEAGELTIDVVRTDAKVNAAVDPTRGRPAKGAAAGTSPLLPAAAPDPLAQRVQDDVNKVRTDLLRAQTAGKQLDNARRAGDLVALSEFEARAAELGRTVRERMHSIVRQLAERVAAEKDPRTIVALMGEEIDAAFARLADEIEAGEQALIEADEELLAEPAEDLVDDALDEGGA